jgi:hypothetical protein
MPFTFILTYKESTYTMDIKFANNASSQLVAGISETDTELSIIPGTGALFPFMNADTDYFMITVTDTGTGDFEIMKVTEKVTDAFTVVRAQEGTLARAFPQNCIVENRLTAGSIDRILNDVSATSITAGRIRIASKREVRDAVVSDAAVTPSNAVALRVLPGSIIAFSGAFDNTGHPIDSLTQRASSDWVLCDGRNNTPDLRSRFLLGFSNDYPQNTIGGGFKYTPKVNDGKTAEVALSLEQIPSHAHTYAKWGRTGGSNGWDTSADATIYDTTGTTESVGGSKGHAHDTTIEEMTIIPKYYAVAFIMKV